MSIHNQSRQAQTILSRIYENLTTILYINGSTQQIVGNKLHEWADTHTECLIVTFLELVNIILISADLDEHSTYGCRQILQLNEDKLDEFEAC